MYGLGEEDVTQHKMLKHAQYKRKKRFAKP